MHKTYQEMSVNLYFVTKIYNVCVWLQLNNIESMLLKEDEELLSGYLSVNVQTGHGFLTTCSKYSSKA